MPRLSSPVVTHIAAAALLILTASVPALSEAATPQVLEARVQALAEQLEALKAELAQVKAQTVVATETARAGADAIPAPATQGTSGLSFFGYGELNLSAPRNNAAAASADVSRFVLGVGYRFDEKTRLVSELEIEHAVSSAHDPGEVEVEQAYIERDLTAGVYA
jgi:hypothetical protein